MRAFFFVLFLSSLLFSAASANSQKDIEDKITKLILQMTLEEKLGQLQQLDGLPEGPYREEHPEMIRKGLLGSTLNVRGAKETNLLQRIAMNESRLKIPVLFGFDVIHGYRTIFPVPLAETSSFEPHLAEESSRIAALEASAVGLKWTFAPMLDISRDPRWGRIVESAGEDPFLSSVMAKYRVRGFQGSDPSNPNRVMACAKHWVGYGAAEGGRDYNTTEITESTLRNVYFPPFKAAIDAGVGTFMTSFNDLNGVPASANTFTLTEVLRNEWKFDGFVVSDYESVKELIDHGMASDERDAARYALTAGLDMEMVSRVFMKHIPYLLEKKIVHPKNVDEAVRRVLRIKYRLGLFDNPYTDESREATDIAKREHKMAARHIAGRSIVLLKNDRAILPLKKNLKSIAVIGPLADDKQAPLGSWHGDGVKDSAVSVLEGLRAAVSTRTQIHYVKGSEISGDKDFDVASAVQAAVKSEVAVVVLGESAEMSGEASARSDLNLPGRQLELLKALARTKTPLVLVLKNGRPLTIDWEAENIPAILETWFLGSEAGHAIADVLFGDVNPGGKLPVTFPRAVGQIPIYYNHKSTGRPHRDVSKFESKLLDLPSTPLFPFGYGLSYTEFSLTDLRLDRTQVSVGERIKISVNLKNIGKVSGSEVVQLYIQDVASAIVRPVKELKGFRRVDLEPNQSEIIEFTLRYEDLGYYSPKRYTVEPGEFKIMVGTDSATGLVDRFEAL